MPRIKVIRVIQPGPRGPTGTGTYLSSNTARVDPSGDDVTGTAGDPARAFLTHQAALTALENQGGFQPGSPAIVLLPIQDTSEDVTTSLEYVVFIGLGQYNVSAPAIGIVTFTGITVLAGFENLFVNGVLAPNASSGIEIELNSSYVNGDISCHNDTAVLSNYNNGQVSGTITCGDGNSMVIRGIKAVQGQQGNPTLNAPNGFVEIDNSIIDTVTAASSIDLYDSRIITNNSGVIPTYHDTLLNPALMDFSTLPQATSEPAIDTGKAWIDTTGGLNIVKVKL